MATLSTAHRRHAARGGVAVVMAMLLFIVLYPGSLPDVLNPDERGHKDEPVWQSSVSAHRAIEREIRLAWSRCDINAVREVIHRLLSKPEGTVYAKTNAVNSILLPIMGEVPWPTGSTDLEAMGAEIVGLWRSIWDELHDLNGDAEQREDVPRVVILPEDVAIPTGGIAFSCMSWNGESWSPIVILAQVAVTGERVDLEEVLRHEAAHCRGMRMRWARPLPHRWEEGVASWLSHGGEAVLEQAYCIGAESHFGKEQGVRAEQEARILDERAARFVDYVDGVHLWRGVERELGRESTRRLALDLLTTVTTIEEVLGSVDRAGVGTMETEARLLREGRVWLDSIKEGADVAGNRVVEAMDRGSVAEELRRCSGKDLEVAFLVEICSATLRREWWAELKEASLRGVKVARTREVRQIFRLGVIASATKLGAGEEVEAWEAEYLRAGGDIRDLPTRAK